MRQFKASLGASAVIVVLLVSQLLTASHANAVSTSYPPAGTVLVNGSQWAGSYASKGDLNVYSNGSAGNGNCSGGKGTYGCQWQCVELAQRWAAIGLNETVNIWPVGSAFEMWSEGPKLPVPFQQHPNGGADQPQFGDLLIFNWSKYNSFGHVAVVKDVQNGHVDIVEQNSLSSGQDSLPINGTYMPPAYNMTIIGWLRSVNSPTPSTTFTAASDPVAVNGGPNGIDLFVTGKDGNLYHRDWDAGVWYAWESLRQPAGVSLVGDVSVIVNHPNPIDLFARGSNSGLYHRYYEAGAWQPWQQLASGLAADPVAGSGSGFHTLDVFYPDTGSGTVWDTYYTASNNTWTTSYVPNGNSVQRKVAVRETSGLIELTVRGGGGEVYSVWFTGSWSGWADRLGQTNGDPTTATTSTGEIDLFVPGLDTYPYVCNNGVVCSWKRMCGATISGSDVAAVTTGPDPQDDFYRNAGGSLSYCGNLGYGYDMGGGLVGTPSAIGGSPDELDVFVHGLDNIVYWKSFTSSGWSPYVSMGNQIGGTQ